MVVRFTDNILENIDKSDFIIRRRLPSAVQISCLFLIAFIVIVWGDYYASYLQSKIMFIAILLISLVALCFGSIFIITNSRKLAMTSEYQNVMFASVAKVGSRFCILVDKLGRITYIDPGFQEIFPSFAKADVTSLNGLLSFAEIPEISVRKIDSIIKKNVSEGLMVPIQKANGEILELFVNVEPILRPKGYFVIRARDYIRKREDDEDTKRAKQIVFDNYKIIEPALYHIKKALLITNPKGVVVFANQKMEDIVGYSTAEMVKSEISLDDLFEQHQGLQPIRDYEGEAKIFRIRNSEFVANISQKLLTDKNGNFVAIKIEIND